MAKKQDVTISIFNIAGEKGKEQVQLKFKVVHQTSMFKGDNPVEHVTNFDLLMPLTAHNAKAIKQYVIDWQKIGREAGSHAKMRELEATPVTWARLYPGRGAVTHVREMSLEDIEKKALSDPEYRKALIARLERVQDVVDGNGK